MKRLFALAVVGLFVSFAGTAHAQCTKIQSGLLLDSNGNVIKTGYDQWGYNYQAHMFNGLADNFGRSAPPLTEGTENLVMKWSDDWLANVDCNGDGKLDRGLDSKTGASLAPPRGGLPTTTRETTRAATVNCTTTRILRR